MLEEHQSVHNTETLFHKLIFKAIHLKNPSLYTRFKFILCGFHHKWCKNQDALPECRQCVGLYGPEVKKKGFWPQFYSQK